MTNRTRRGFLGSVSGAAAASLSAQQQTDGSSLSEKRRGQGSIKITDKVVPTFQVGRLTRLFADRLVLPAGSHGPIRPPEVRVAGGPPPRLGTRRPSQRQLA